MTEATFAGWLWVVDEDGALRGARWIDGDVRTVKHLLDDAVFHGIYIAGYLGWLLVVDGQVYFDDSPAQDDRATELMSIVPELVGKQLSPTESEALATCHFLQIKAQATQSGLLPMPPLVE